MAFPVIYDACVLYPPSLRDLLIRLAMERYISSEYETLISALELPDSNDRHVLAAAIKSGAQVIVTSNLKDFPRSILCQWDIEAQTPDRFVLHVLDLSPARVVTAVQQQADALKNPSMSVGQVLGRLQQNGLNESVVRISELMGVAVSN